MKSIFDLESDIYATLSHPKRLEILHLLSHKDMTVNELAAMSGLAQATVSQHLILLKRLLLVNSQKDGQLRIYSLSSKKIVTLLRTARSLFVTSKVLPEIFTDPVCKMEVTAQTAATTLKHRGETHYFCGTGCEKQFRRTITNGRGTHV